jgi:hypothetical protein
MQPRAIAVKAFSPFHYSNMMSPYSSTATCDLYHEVSSRAFKRIAPHLPRRNVSNQVILYPRSLVDEALYAAESPEEAIVGVCRHADKRTRSETLRGDTGTAESLRKALNRS